MTTLSDLRSRLRLELHDAGASTRWDDSALDRHLTRALEQLSDALPRHLTALVPTTPGSLEFSIASLFGLVDVARVEYPADVAGAAIEFQRWGDSIIVASDGPVPDGSEARVRYLGSHVLDGAGSTLSSFEEEMVVLGASGFAAQELAAASIDALSTGGERVSADFLAWGQARLIAFHQLLHHHRRPRPLRVRQAVRS